MLYSPKSNGRAEHTLAMFDPLSPLDWETQAITAYTQAAHQATDQLCQELTAQLLQLTGHTIDPHSIYRAPDSNLATVRLGTALFRLHNHTLHLVRPCLDCGVGALESPAIRCCSDLGYALAYWEPRCERCGEDGEDWTWSW